MNVDQRAILDHQVSREHQACKVHQVKLACQEKPDDPEKLECLVEQDQLEREVTPENKVRPVPSAIQERLDRSVRQVVTVTEVCREMLDPRVILVPLETLVNKGHVDPQERPEARVNLETPARQEKMGAQVDPDPVVSLDHLEYQAPKEKPHERARKEILVQRDQSVIVVTRE